ncbi:MAG: ion transporter [Methylacidiphilales bacterium]|nr:ion transporter [Candidatus Methylacidiphilales bacterium]MDW8348684.1 ion transporter [Verrucomicrobiae bacterium]
MSLQELELLKSKIPSDHWRVRLATWVESNTIQHIIVAIIFFNALILALETDSGIMSQYGFFLSVLDKSCLAIFCLEIFIKLIAYRRYFWVSGWNIFDFLVVGIALLPAAGTWSVLRALRVLRVLRLLTIVPSMRRVVAAFIHSIPGLASVIAVMCVFYFTGAVLATKLFGQTHPQWFGNIGASLYSLFQIMTLESWSMGIVRPLMEKHPWAWAFFVPFIIVATFTILNLFIGIIVSTMQELSQKESENKILLPRAQGNCEREFSDTIKNIERELERLRLLISGLNSNQASDSKDENHLN